jgi:predicted Zn-dependent protease with MMP-like domain
MAGGWEEGVDEDGTPYGGEARVREEIRITVLHEIGHHFGLGEDDLERLGYA